MDASVQKTAKRASSPEKMAFARLPNFNSTSVSRLPLASALFLVEIR